MDGQVTRCSRTSGPQPPHCTSSSPAFCNKIVDDFLNPKPPKSNSSDIIYISPPESFGSFHRSGDAICI